MKLTRVLYLIFFSLLVLNNFFFKKKWVARVTPMASLGVVLATLILPKSHTSFFFYSKSFFFFKALIFFYFLIRYRTSVDVNFRQFLDRNIISVFNHKHPHERIVDSGYGRLISARMYTPKHRFLRAWECSLSCFA
jgi:hypothetical protein